MFCDFLIKVFQEAPLINNHGGAFLMAHFQKD